MFDPRIFDEGNAMQSEPNIEFHIHAFLSPNAQRPPQQNQSSTQSQATHQEVGVGPADGSSNNQNPF